MLKHYAPLISRMYSTSTQQSLSNYKGLLSPVWTHMTDIVVEKAEGSWIYGTDGKKYLDFTCGIAVTNLGHCHPRVVKAAQDQMGKIMHGQANIVWHKPMLQLANSLSSIVKLSPNGEDRYFFSNSGAEAIEASIKLARHATKKTNIITFDGSFHGRTIGTMSLTNSKTVYRVGYQPLMPGVFVAPFPYCLRCPCRGAGVREGESSKGGQCEGECCGVPLDRLRDMLKMISAPEETAAIIVEPILGEGGYVPAPVSFLQGLRKICDENQILLIFDEVQTGFGRTGKWFAMEHYGVTPDILVMAKGIANGLPLSGIIAREELHKKWKPGSHGGTYGGNAVACAAAVETINVMRDENVLSNVCARGQQMFTRLQSIKASNKGRYPLEDIRGKGLMVGVEFPQHLKGVAGQVTQRCLHHGMLMLTAGAFESLRFIPPLTATPQEIDLGIDIFEKALNDVFPK